MHTANRSTNLDIVRRGEAWVSNCGAKSPGFPGSVRFESFQLQSFRLSLSPIRQGFRSEAPDVVVATRGHASIAAPLATADPPMDLCVQSSTSLPAWLRPGLTPERGPTGSIR